MYARVTLDHFSDKEFDYRIPAALAAQVSAGTRVIVPFGSAHKPGTVLAVQSHAAVGEHRIKEILAIATDGAVANKTMMELLNWVQRYYGGSMGRVMRCAIPAVVRHAKVKEAAIEWVEKEVQASPVVAFRSKHETAVMEKVLQSAGRIAMDSLLDASGASRQVIRRLQKKGFVRVTREPWIRGLPDAAPSVFTAPKPVLNEEQRHAVEVLSKKLIEGFHCVLLKGVTGSGKTEVYLRVIGEALKSGRSALVLVPEISLTPQTIDRFRSRFQQPIAVLHSGLSDAERMDQWRMIHRGEANIVIGARSAVFAPLANLGVIIVDEEQEKSFKQQEAPHYHARDVAVMRAKIEKALIVLGSATPSLESYHNAARGKYELLELLSRVDHRAMPKIHIVDMRLESTKNGAIPILSARLAALVQARLDRKEQTMLFLNRRGYHRCLWCPTCAQALQCPHCSVTVTYHRVGTKLLCHLCGFTCEPMTRCTQCASDLLIPQGYGTQKIEGMLRKWFAQARIARMDADTTRRNGSHRDILSRFAMGQVDILVGTQMIAKGHDFPNVTLVGVLNADMGLNVPDFRAAEQTYQLLTQVSGRAGRGMTGGEVIIQTHMPEHYMMAAVKAGDYKSFYEREMALRNELGYPPKTHLALISVKHASEAKAQQWARTLHAASHAALKGLAVVMNPTPAPVQKSMDLHRWQILMKTNVIPTVQEKLGKLLEELKIPPQVRVDIDTDPQSLA